MDSNYIYLSKKIKKAKTIEELNRLDESLNNLYNNGIFTISEFSRLDLLIVDYKIKL